MLDSPGSNLLVRAWQALLMTEDRPLPGNPITAIVRLILLDDDREVLEGDEAEGEVPEEAAEARGAGGATPIGRPIMIGLWLTVPIGAGEFGVPPTVCR